MDKDRLRYLINQYITDSCTPAELAELNLTMSVLAATQQIKDVLDEIWIGLDEDKLADVSAEKAQNIMKRIIGKPRKKKPDYSGWLKIAVIGLIIFTLGILLFYDHFRNGKSLVAMKYADTTEVLPGGRKAKLILSNGSSINLSSKQEGIIIKQGRVTYADGTQILKDDAGPYLQLTTPRGGEYQLTLSDGTNVTMNSASTLTYPVHFAKGIPREVKLEGEAFFDVAHTKDQPFTVRTTEQVVEVLGTAFNVAAYKDDGSVTTTLSEGSVRVRKVSQKTEPEQAPSMVLKVGQQAVVRPETDRIEVRSIELNEALAWKDGLFIFNNEDVKSMMTRLSRWYNIDVVYEDDVGNVKFLGNYSRHKSLNNLLKSIELTERVKFRIENSINEKRRIVIGQKK